MTPDMAVVTPLNNFLGPEGDTVTVDEQLLNTESVKEVDQGTQTDPLVFTFENQLVVLPPFVFPHGVKWSI